MSDFLLIIVLERTGLGGPSHDGGTFNDAHNVGLLHDQKFLPIERHLGAWPLAEQDAVAGLDVERAELALVAQRATANGDDLALLRLLLGGVGDYDAAHGFLVGRQAANEYAVMKRTEAHTVLSPRILFRLRRLM
jgi:hypothetical protein